MFYRPSQRLALAICAALCAAVGQVSAGDSDIANVRILSGGGEEAVEIKLNELAVGESRQLTAASGKPAVVTRTEDGLVVEIAGKRTEVHFPAADGAAQWVEGEAAADGKQVRIIKIDRDDIQVSGEGGKKVIVMKRHHGDDAEPVVLTEDLLGADGEPDEAKIRALVDAQHDGGEQERVIVTRRVVKDAEAP